MTVRVDATARCDATAVGAGTTIGPFTLVMAGAEIGSGCAIGAHVLVEGGVVLDDDVTVSSGVQLWQGTRIGVGVVIGPNATLTNRPLRSGDGAQAPIDGIEVGPGAALGANCTLLPGVRIGRGAQVGAGAVVTHDVPPNAIVVGNPARIVGYASEAIPPSSPAAGEADQPLPDSVVAGAGLHQLRQATDLRGSLVAANFGDDLPFLPRRAFVVYDVPGKHVRGAHAHRVCEQFLVCLRGAITCLIDDGRRRQEFRLDDPAVGLHMPAMVWGTQHSYTPDAVLLVFASHEYDPDDYIRDYDDFLAELAR